MAGVVKQLAGGGSGQSFMDRVTAAKHSISGAGLAKAVCKATTEEIVAPKKKHLHFLTKDNLSRGMEYSVLVKIGLQNLIGQDQSLVEESKAENPSQWPQTPPVSGLDQSDFEGCFSPGQSAPSFCLSCP